MASGSITQQELEALYAECAAALDDAEYERWPSFFAEQCSYSITTKENVDRGWPMCLMSCETRGMLLDRVTAVRKTLFIIPRIQRRLVTGVRVTEVDGELTHTRASFAVFETFTGELTTFFVSGRFIDVVVREGAAARFVKRTCILDSALVPNSLPFPL